MPDALLEEARNFDALEHTTIKVLIEEGLCKTIDDRKSKQGFKLRKATFNGNGSNRDADGASWEKLREMSYEGRGV